MSPPKLGVEPGRVWSDQSSVCPSGCTLNELCTNNTSFHLCSRQSKIPEHNFSVWPPPLSTPLSFLLFGPKTEGFTRFGLASCSPQNAGHQMQSHRSPLGPRSYCLCHKITPTSTGASVQQLVLAVRHSAQTFLDFPEVPVLGLLFSNEEPVCFKGRKSSNQKISCWVEEYKLVAYWTCL